MLTLAEVENRISLDGIHIHDYAISETKKAACVHAGDYKAIAVNRRLINNTAEEKSVLAEEYGHFATGGLYFLEAAYNAPVSRINRQKVEAQAKRHAVRAMLQFDELKAAVQNGYTETWELADVFDVTETFIKFAIEYYTGACGFRFDEDA